MGPYDTFVRNHTRGGEEQRTQLLSRLGQYTCLADALGTVRAGRGTGIWARGPEYTGLVEPFDRDAWHQVDEVRAGIEVPKDVFDVLRPEIRRLLAASFDPAQGGVEGQDGHAGARR